LTFRINLLDYVMNLYQEPNQPPTEEEKVKKWRKLFKCRTCGNTYFFNDEKFSELYLKNSIKHGITDSVQYHQCESMVGRNNITRIGIADIIGYQEEIN